MHTWRHIQTFYSKFPEYISKRNDATDVCKIIYMQLTEGVLPVERMAGLGVGMGEVKPNDQQEMTPTELNARRCGHVTTPVGAGETVTLTCPQGGVTGRYLIVQTLGRWDFLTICEVEAGKTTLNIVGYPHTFILAAVLWLWPKQIKLHGICQCWNIIWFCIIWNEYMLLYWAFFSSTTC